MSSERSLVLGLSVRAHLTWDGMSCHSRITYREADTFGDVMTFRTKSSEREEKAWVLDCGRRVCRLC